MKKYKNDTKVDQWLRGGGPTGKSLQLVYAGGAGGTGEEW